jgi:coenzyme F420-reducing hydrogenase delta subunit
MNNQGLKIYVFYCSNGLEQDQLAGLSELDGITLKAISLPCSGKVDIPYLVKAFETGADGVVIVSCKQNDCRYLEGDARARKRAEAVESLLEEIGMGKGRVAVISLKEDNPEQIISEIKDFFEKIRNLTQPHPSDVAFSE